MYNLYHPSPRGIDPCAETFTPLVTKRLATSPVFRFTLKCAFSVPESKNTVNLTRLFSPCFTKNEDVNVCVALLAPVSNVSVSASHLIVSVSKVSNDVKL